MKGNGFKLVGGLLATVLVVWVVSLVFTRGIVMGIYDIKLKVPWWVVNEININTSSALIGWEEGEDASWLVYILKDGVDPEKWSSFLEKGEVLTKGDYLIYRVDTKLMPQLDVIDGSLSVIYAFEAHGKKYMVGVLVTNNNLVEKMIFDWWADEIAKSLEVK